jgi:hypothetical protein
VHYGADPERSRLRRLQQVRTTEPSRPRPIWAVDIIGAASALMLALLVQAGQSLRYASGLIVAAMSSA